MSSGHPICLFLVDHHLNILTWSVLLTPHRYEEWDVDATTSGRIKGAMKYSLCFLMLVMILLVVGFFLPVAQETGGHLDLDYFKRLLLENRSYPIDTL